MFKKNIFSTIIILFAACLIMLLNGCTQTGYTYGIVGTPAVSADGQYITVLVAESKGTTHQVNGGYRSTDYHTSYWLKLYETATGKLIKKKIIVEAAEEKNMLVVCYGGYGNKIWLHTNWLTAYDINSLEELVNEKTLARQNNFDVNNFPDDQRFIVEGMANGHIRFTATPGARYVIDLNSLKISNEKESPKNAGNTINQQLRFLNTHNAVYGVRSDTLNSIMFILAKDNNSAINSYPGNSDNEPVYKRMYLFSATYTLNKTGSHEFYLYSNLKQFFGPSYLNGIFLKDFNTDKTVRLQKPGAYIILHNDSLGNNSKSILTAIDESNNPIWQLNPGLSTMLTSCVATNKYCIITGNKQNLLGPHIGSDMLCVVNIETGKMVTPSIKE
jgi:hypothetical protein